MAGLYRLGVDERIVELERLGWLSSAQAQALRDGTQIMSVTNADKLIENVFGGFALIHGAVTALTVFVAGYRSATQFDWSDTCHGCRRSRLSVDIPASLCERSY